MKKAYVIPGQCLPVGFDGLDNLPINLILRTSLGCEICAVLRGEPIVAYEVSEKNPGEFQDQKKFREHVARSVETKRFNFPSLSDDASFEQFSRSYTKYNSQYNKWNEQNLTLKAVEDKLKSAGDLNFQRQNFLGRY